MNRAPFAFINIVVTLASLVAAILLIIPVKFNGNKSIINGTGGDLKITWRNLYCQIPQPNLNVHADELYEFWGLPNDVRLSQAMINTAKCSLAMSKKSENDSSNCYCIYNLWVPFMTFVNISVALFAFADLLSIFELKNRPMDGKEFKTSFVYEVARGITMVMAIFFFWTSSDDGYSYVKYGDVYPIKYFDNPPFMWILGFGIFFISNSVLCFQFLAMLTCMDQKKIVEIEEEKGESNETSVQSMQIAIQFEIVEVNEEPIVEDPSMLIRLDGNPSESSLSLRLLEWSNSDPDPWTPVDFEGNQVKNFEEEKIIPVIDPIPIKVNKSDEKEEKPEGWKMMMKPACCLK